MPSLEIEKIADLKVLFDIGVITPDVSIQLTELLMGDKVTARRKRMQLEEEEEQVASKKAAISKRDQGYARLETCLMPSPRLVTPA